MADPFLEEDPYLAELEALQQEQFQPGQFKGGFMERFAPLRDLNLPRPQSFGQGLLQGIATGLGGQGARAQQARQRFEENEAERRKSFDVERRAASRELRSLSGQDRRARLKEQSDERKARKKYEEETHLLSPQDAKDFPHLARVADAGGRVPKKWLEEVTRPESPAQKARADRADATAGIQAQAAQRQERLATVNTISKLADDYRVDPDIVAYRTGQQNLGTMREAAKLKSGAGDLALLIAYVRATEPGVLSVVRQEELSNVQRATGELRRYMNLPAQWVSGQRLTDSGRKEMLDAGEKVSGAQKSAYERANSQYLDRAKAFEVDPSLFMREYGQPGAASGRVPPQATAAPTQYKPGGFFDRNRPGR